MNGKQCFEKLKAKKVNFKLWDTKGDATTENFENILRNGQDGVAVFGAEWDFDAFRDIVDKFCDCSYMFDPPKYPHFTPLVYVKSCGIWNCQTDEAAELLRDLQVSQGKFLQERGWGF